MFPKKAIIILLIMAVLTAIVVVALYLKQQSDLELKTGEQSEAVFNIQDIVNKKNQEEELAQKEQEYLEKIITEKAEQKAEKISNKPEEEIMSFGYTQDELDFIANPREAVKEELGIEQETEKAKFYTQEELDNIANPK